MYIILNMLNILNKYSINRSVKRLYKDKFSRVWFWNEFPHQSSIGGKDTGIDLVAWNSYSILSEANKVVEWIQLIISGPTTQAAYQAVEK